MAPMKMKPKMSMRLTMMGTITRSVGMYRSFPTSSKPMPRVLEEDIMKIKQEKEQKEQEHYLAPPVHARRQL